jgi:hypothetical protein
VCCFCAKPFGDIVRDDYISPATSPCPSCRRTEASRRTDEITCDLGDACSLFNEIVFHEVIRSHEDKAIVRLHVATEIHKYIKRRRDYEFERLNAKVQRLEKE